MKATYTVECGRAVQGDGIRFRGLLSLPFQLNLSSSSVHHVTQLDS